MISRQRKYQLKKENEGLCIICGKEAMKPRLCRSHNIKQKQLQANYYAQKRIEKAYHKGFYEGTLATGGEYKNKLPS